VGVNPDKRLSSRNFYLIGLDPQASGALPDIETMSGRRVTVADLGPGEAYIDESAADDLDLRQGESVQIIAFGKTTTFKVKAIVHDRRLAGAGGVSVRRAGAVVPLAVAQQLFDADGRLSMIAVSNRGDAREGA